MNDLVAAVYEIREHAPRYDTATGYYEGTIGELFTSEAVKRALKGSSGGFDINLAARAVDAVLDRTRILALTVPDDETGTRDLVDRVWVPNRMDRRAKTVHRSALVNGDAYLTVWDGDVEGTVDLHYNRPGTTRVFYDPENPQVKTHAAKLWCEGKGDAKRHRVNLYYPDRIERWITEKGKDGSEPAHWAEYSDDGAPWPIPNPHGEVPVFHFRTDEPYGRPVHRSAFGPQNAITKLSATLISTVDFQAFPQRYKLTKAGEVTHSDLFDDDDDPQTAAPGIEAGPGKILELQGDAAGQFDPADMQAFLQPLGFYVRSMAAATATPLRFFDPQGQVPSGEALRADEAPLAQRIVDLAELFGEVWQEALVFAARVIGLAVSPPDIAWAPVQTVDDLAGWQTVAAKQTAGVPARQALVEAGYTSELVEGWLAGSDTPNLNTRVEMLVKLAPALQALGSAVTLGAVDQGTVATILGQLLGDLVQEPPADAA